MSGEGTWRPFLDEVVLKGARVYALRMLSIKRVHQAVTDLATARLRLTSIAAIHILCDNALDAVPTHAGYAKTALDAVSALIIGASGASAALAKVATHAGTEADAAADKIAAQVDDANIALDACFAIVAAITGVSGDLPNAIVELGKVNADLLTGAEGVWADEVKYITGGTAITGAQPLLETGKALINTVNVGDSVAEQYASYSQREAEIAALWGQKRAHFLEEAARHADTMNGYFTAAIQRLGVMARYIDEAAGRIAMANAYRDEASVRVNMADAFISEANGRLSSANGYVSEAQARLATCQEYAREASQRIDEMRTYIQESEQYQLAADREMAASTRYQVLASEAMAEFQAVLADRAQYRTNVAVAAARQPR